MKGSTEAVAAATTTSCCPSKCELHRELFIDNHEMSLLVGIYLSSYGAVQGCFCQDPCTEFKFLFLQAG